MNETYLSVRTVILDRYRLCGLIGRGGMGEVHAAEDLKLGGKLRAVKLLSRAAAGGESLATEASMLIGLRHPHLPQIVDYLPAADGLPALLVMDYVDGVSLRRRMECTGLAWKPAACVRIADQLCEALLYLHSREPAIIHRDLKPSNVLLADSGFLHLIDFGIARHAREGRDTLQLGTPGFAAPEQGGPQGRSDERSDQYGLGALLVYLLGGGMVYTPARDEGRLHRLCPEASPGLIAILERMLARDPERRFSSVAAVREALLRTVPQAEPGSRSVPLPALSSPGAAVVSAAPGSGGTFIAVTLAKLLARAGMETAYVEHFGQTPEAFQLLPGDWRPLSGSNGYMVRIDRESGAKLVALEPSGHGRSQPSTDSAAKHRLMCGSFPGAYVVHDVSCRIRETEAELLKSRIETLVVVADPFPSKWPPHRMEELRKLASARKASGLATHWVANKDLKFSNRSEWLSLLPERPAAFVPHLPAAEWADRLWNGGWATSHRKWGRRLSEALKPLAEAVRQQAKTYGR